MVELLLEHGAVGQAGQHVVEREVGDPPLALLDLRGHLVEARRQSPELVLAAHLDFDVLARGQPAGRLVEPGQRLGDAPGGAPGAERGQREAEDGDQGQRQLQLAGRGQRLVLGISEDQDRSVAAEERRQRLGERDRGPAVEAHLERRAALQMGVHDPRRGPVEVHGRGGFGPPAPAFDHHVGMERNCRQPFERPHLALVEVGGEHHPADQARGHHRGGDDLLRLAAEHGDPGEAAGVERLPQAGGLARHGRVLDPVQRAVQRDDERVLDPQPRGDVAQRRLHGGVVVGGDGGAEAEIARQQLGRALELVLALLPKAIVDGAARLQLAFDLARGGAGDEGRQRRRNAEHRHREQQGELDRQPRAQRAEAAGVNSHGSSPSAAGAG